jgi:outer membrane protein OmpA-like peptidoglycan-associated protein
MAHSLAPHASHFMRASVIVAVCGSVLSSVSARAQTVPAPAPPPTPVAFQEALLNAANTLFSKANLQGASNRITLVIDPLIDGSTGAQSTATQSMERRIADLVRTNYPRFEVTPFTTEVIAKLPVVLIGTFTAINNAAVAGGPRDVYRVCLALADLKTNRIISKGATRALPQGIDPTPTAFFATSPGFVRDPATEAYIKNCQGTRLGDPIDQVYVDRIQVAVHVNNGIEAYNAKNYEEALEHFEKARRAPGGEQLRVFNGLYLTNWKLNRREAAREAFGRIVDFGLEAQRLSVKFLFMPNSARFGSDRGVDYTTWVREIALRTVKAGKCLEVVGHTSATGSADVNDRLSLQRAEYVKGRLQEATLGANATTFVAKGAGSSELIVGTGRDDASDALDRRVEFKTIPCAVPIAKNEKSDRTVRPTRASNGNSANSRRATEDGEYSAPRIPRGIESEIQRYLNSGGLRQLLDD